jgi:hypothetical protein
VTSNARELARLPVPNIDGMIRMKINVMPNAGPHEVETRWIELSFTEFAKIQNVLDGTV